MYSTGHIRKLDSLGRITLPSDIRKQLNLSINDSLEIFTKDNLIVLRKYEPADIFTGNTANLISYHGKKISKESILELAKLAGLQLQTYN